MCGTCSPRARCNSSSTIPRRTVSSSSATSRRSARALCGAPSSSTSRTHSPKRCSREATARAPRSECEPKARALRSIAPRRARPLPHRELRLLWRHGETATGEERAHERRTERAEVSGLRARSRVAEAVLAFVDEVLAGGAGREVRDAHAVLAVRALDARRVSGAGRSYLAPRLAHAAREVAVRVAGARVVVRAGSPDSHLRLAHAGVGA